MTTGKPSVVLLAVSAGMSPFGMAILLPAIPGLVDRFDSDYATLQFVVSAYLAGLGLSQVVSGFLCDRYGRRPVVLIGYAIFVAATIGCALAGSLAELIGFRFAQALGVSTGTVASRAIIRDTFAADVGGKAMSYITIGLGTAPVIAPMLGGWLDAAGGETAIFVATAVVGSIVLILLATGLTETRHEDDPVPELSAWLSSYTRLLRSSVFLGFTLVYGFVQGSFFSFLAVGASVFENDFGLSASEFGVIWGAMAIAYVIGASLGGRLSVSAVSEFVLPVAVLLTPVGGLLLFAA